VKCFTGISVGTALGKILGAGLCPPGADPEGMYGWGARVEMGKGFDAEASAWRSVAPKAPNRDAECVEGMGIGRGFPIPNRS